MNFPEWISTMTVAEVADTVLAYLKVLAWPLFLLLVLHKFRIELQGLLARLKSLDGGPVKASFHDISSTVQNAAEADADATKKQEEARAKAAEAEAKAAAEAGNQVPRVDGPEKMESPGGVAVGDLGEKQAEDEAPHNRDFQEVSVDDSGGWVPRGHPAWTISLHKVDRAWRDLEVVTGNLVKTFDLGATDPDLEKRPEDPALFFRHMQRNYGGSRKATDAAISARRLRKQMYEGIVLDRDEAEALAGAVRDLKSSAQKYASLLTGRRLAKHLLEKYGDETLPPMGS